MIVFHKKPVYSTDKAFDRQLKFCQSTSINIRIFFQVGIAYVDDTLAKQTGLSLAVSAEVGKSFAFGDS